MKCKITDTEVDAARETYENFVGGGFDAMAKALSNFLLHRLPALTPIPLPKVEPPIPCQESRIDPNSSHERSVEAYDAFHKRRAPANELLVANTEPIPAKLAVDHEGVHAAHCCAKHGCKYGDRDCPVVLGAVEAMYDCEDCVADAREQSTLETELAAALARIAELESQQQNWRLSSVCREKDNALKDSQARELALREALKEAIDHVEKGYGYVEDLNTKTTGEQCIQGAIEALSTPPPDVVWREDAEKLLSFIENCNCGYDKCPECTAAREFRAKHPKPEQSCTPNTHSSTPS